MRFLAHNTKEPPAGLLRQGGRTNDYPSIMMLTAFLPNNFLFRPYSLHSLHMLISWGVGNKKRIFCSYYLHEWKKK